MKKSEKKRSQPYHKKGSGDDFEAVSNKKRNYTGYERGNESRSGAVHKPRCAEKVAGGQTAYHGQNADSGFFRSR